MADFKRNIVTMTIGGLVTAIGFVSNIWDTILGPAQPTVGYAVPVVQVPQSGFDFWWWRILWSLALLAVVVVIAGFGWSFFVDKHRKQEKMTERERKLTEQLKFQQKIASGNPQGQLQPVAPPKIEFLSLQEAVNKSTKDKWVMGQGIEYQLDKSKAHIAGKLFEINPNSHFSILGATRSGKTKSTAFHLVLLARIFKWHVIVLDGKGGLDWRKYGNIVEWHDLTPQNLTHYVNAVHDVYLQRREYLNAYDAGELSELPEGKKLPHVLVIFEEFGTTWVKANKSKEIDTIMDDLFRLSCATGLHMCLVDQAPQLWSSNMATNAAIAFCFRAKGQTLNAFGGYYCGNLQVGQFCDDTSIYKSWYVAGEDVLPRLPAQTRRLLKLPANEPRTEDKNAGSFAAFSTLANTGSQNERTSATRVSLPPSVIRSFGGNSDWDKAAKQYFLMYPDAEHIDWCKAMALLADDGREYTAFKGGLSQRLYHAYSPKGKGNKNDNPS